MIFFKKGVLFALFMGIYFFAMAQEQEKKKLDETIIYDQEAFRPERLKNLQWLYFEKYFSYAEGDTLHIDHIDDPEKNHIVSLYELNHPENVSSFEAAEPIQAERPFVKPLEEFPAITWMDARNFYFVHENTYYVYDTKKELLKRVFDFPKEAENLNFDPHQYHLAYTIENHLYVMDRDGTTFKIPGSEKRNVWNGQHLFKDEFGNAHTTFWSSKGERLAFYQVRYPEDQMAEAPFSRKGPAPPGPVKVGVPQIQIGVFSFETDSTIFLDDPVKAPYRINLSWGPQDYYLYVTAINEDNNHLWLNEFDAQTGDFIHTLLQENFNKGITHLKPVVFIPGDRRYNKKFIWLSARDGHVHYYRYDIKGNLLNQVTHGDWDVIELIGFSGDAIVVSGTTDQGLEVQLYKSQLRYPRMEQLTDDPGVHNALLSTDGRHILDQYTSLRVPGNLQVLNQHGELIKTVLTSEDPLGNKPHPIVRLEQIEAADEHTLLNARVILPPNVDKDKKYPVLIYLGQSMEDQQVTNDWQGNAEVWMYYLADQGYIIFAMDERGTSGTGLAFDHTKYKMLGDREVQDQLKGVQYLLSLPYVDPNRIALLGKDFGGYLAIRMMIENPYQFTTAVAGRPVLDWQYADSLFTQRRLGLNEKDSIIIDKSSLTKQCEKLQGPLLILMNSQEDPVQRKVMDQFLEECQSGLVQIEYMDQDTIDRFVLTKEALEFIMKNNKPKKKKEQMVVGR